MIHLAMLMIVSSSHEELLSRHIRNSVDTFHDENISIELFTFPGVDSMDEVPLHRANIISKVDDRFTHILFVDPDDMIDGNGLKLSIRQMINETDDLRGILLKERTLGGKMTKHCCRLLLRTDLAKEWAPKLMSGGGRHLDHEYAQTMTKVLDLPLADDVAYIYRMHKHQLDDGTLPPMERKVTVKILKHPSEALVDSKQSETMYSF